MMQKTNILFVCLGNICRSPMAEGAFRHLVEKNNRGEAFHIDSAATGDWHTGDPPDPRAQDAAKARGIDISMLRARSIKPADFESFDHIIAMDHMNLSDLKGAAPEVHSHKIRLFLSYAPQLGLEEVPDPYFGEPDGFEHVLDMIEIASKNFLKTLDT